MVDSRLNSDPTTIFHCFAKVFSSFGFTDKNQASLSNVFPENFEDKDGLLKQIPTFCFPCAVKSDGVQYSTFVLTDLESKFRFGFCRYPPNAVYCLCIISYLPWFETFYTILNLLSTIPEEDGLHFLELLYRQLIPDPGGTITLKLNVAGKNQTYSIKVPDTRKLPSIPENRNLTEYYAKIQPMNMIYLFVSMLFERRIIVTSEKLSVLTAVVHGSVSLLYPMQWQHIFVPILPPHLIDYCCAPMPFLLGVHSSMMAKVRQMPMNEVVILNADTNEIEFDEKDMDSFPSKITRRLHKHLQRTEKALNKYVSTLFLKALADLIGGYRDALKFTDTPKGGRIVFDDEMFLNTRVGSMKLFLDQILDLQSFRQFIAGRLDMLNDGMEMMDVFEQAVIERNAEYDADVYAQWREKMKKGGGALKKSVEGKYGHLKEMVSEIEVKEMKKKLTSKVKDSYKGIMKIKENKKTEEFESGASVKRVNTMPQGAPKKNPPKVERHSLYASYNRKTHPPPAKTPPPRPPQPFENTHSRLTPKETSSLHMQRKDYLRVETNVIESHSEPNISALLNISSPESSVPGSSEDIFCSNPDLNGRIIESKQCVLNKKRLSRPIRSSDENAQKLSRQNNNLEISHVSKDFLGIETHCPKSYSEPNVNALIDMSSSESSVESSSDDLSKSNSSHSVSSNSEFERFFVNEAFIEDLSKTRDFEFLQCKDNKPIQKSSKESLKRSGPNDSRSKIVPPPRPPPISTSVKPVRPPLISESNFDPTFHHEDNQSISNTIRENLPFYKPSSDLLSLDNSLFQDTVASLSADARLFVTSPLNSRRSAVKELSEKSAERLPGELPSKNLFEVPRKTQSKKEHANDCFADCLQAAKNELELKKKSEGLETGHFPLINDVTALTINRTDSRNRRSNSNFAELHIDRMHYEEI